MSGYEGPAMVVTEEGTVVPVTARLRKEVSGGLQSWDGTIDPTSDADTFAFMPGDITVQMPDGREGRALINNVSISMGSGSGSVRTRIVGNGVAPF